MTFKNRSAYGISGFSPVGAATAKEYALKLDENGKEYLAEVGLIPTYEIIQAHLDASRISSVIAQYEKGDFSVLNKRVGQFIDVTQYPQTLAEAQNTLIEAERIFQNSPLEVRKAYDHSLSQFLKAINDGSFAKQFGKQQPVAEPAVQPAVQPVVQPAAQPVVQPAAQPVVQSAVQPVSDPMYGKVYKQEVMSI